MVEPAKDDKSSEKPVQKTSDSTPASSATTGAKPAASARKGSGLIGKLFTGLILLLILLGAAGYAALIFRDKDERVKVAADYIESELAQAQHLMNTAPQRLTELLGEKKAPAVEDVSTAAPASAPSDEPTPPATATELPAIDKQIAEPAPANEKPAATTPAESEKAPEAPKTAERSKEAAPEKIGEPPHSTEAAIKTPDPAKEIIATPKPIEKPVESAPSAPTAASAAANDDLTAKDLVNALEGRIEALSEEVKTLREKLDQPKNETRATPVAGGASSEAATVVIAFALQKELDAGRPYADEIAALTRTGADPALLDVLSPMATSGAPTGVQLRDQFKPIAKKIHAEEPSEQQDLASHLLHGASKLVHVRPAGTDHPETLDGNLAKIDAALTHDNFTAAAAAFAAMPEWARMQAGEFAQTLDKRAAIAKAAEDLLHGAIAGLGGVKK